MNTFLMCDSLLSKHHNFTRSKVTSLLSTLLVIQDLEEILNLKDKHVISLVHMEVQAFLPDRGQELGQDSEHQGAHLFPVRQPG